MLRHRPAFLWRSGVASHRAQGAGAWSSGDQYWVARMRAKGRGIAAERRLWCPCGWCYASCQVTALGTCALQQALHQHTGGFGTRYQASNMATSCSCVVGRSLCSPSAARRSGPLAAPLAARSSSGSSSSRRQRAFRPQAVGQGEPPPLAQLPPACGWLNCVRTLGFLPLHTVSTHYSVLLARSHRLQLTTAPHRPYSFSPADTSVPGSGLKPELRTAIEQFVGEFVGPAGTSLASALAQHIKPLSTPGCLGGLVTLEAAEGRSAHPP